VSRTGGIFTIATGLAVALSACRGGPPASDDAFPTEPIDLVVPFAAGGAADLAARAFADGLSSAVGQPVVVVNRDGASGTIGGSAVASAAPDGHTLGFVPGGVLTSQPHVIETTYDLNAFSYVCQVTERFLLVSGQADGAFESMADVVTAARANPGAVTYGHPGVGSFPHLFMEQLAAAADIELTAVPFRGDAQSVTNLLGGHITLAATAEGSIAGQQVRPLGVFAASRLERMPDVPTLSESGYDVTTSIPTGVIAPAGVPANVLATLESGCRAAYESEAFLAMVDRTFQLPTFAGGAAFGARAVADSAVMRDVVSALGLGR
jgi:tripartite-type tricarboxylate transporter receptor subunit TctC